MGLRCARTVKTTPNGTVLIARKQPPNAACYIFEGTQFMDAGERFSRSLGKVLAAGLSKAELSRRTGIARALIDDYLSGKSVPGLLQAEKIALACGHGLAEFLGTGPKIEKAQTSPREALRIIARLIREIERQ